MNDFTTIQELQLDDTVLRKFLQSNYRYMSLATLLEVLEVTPEYIQDVLTETQFKRIGTRTAPSILILHAAEDYDEA